MKRGKLKRKRKGKLQLRSMNKGRGVTFATYSKAEKRAKLRV